MDDISQSCHRLTLSETWSFTTSSLIFAVVERRIRRIYTERKIFERDIQTKIQTEPQTGRGKFDGSTGKYVFTARILIT